MQAPKNGFFYVLDRETGECISAKAFVELTWATGVDAECRPIETAEAREMKDATFVKPSPHGGHNWYPMSFNPVTGLVYFSAVDDTRMHVIDDKWTYKPSDQNVGRDSFYSGPQLARQGSFSPKGHLVAWDPAEQREAWRVEHPVPMSGGTLSTAANLVFQGRADGMFRAYRATDGKVLWEFQADPGILAAPMTYTVDGKQYIAVLAGLGGPSVLGNRPLGRGRVGPGRLLVFTLDGAATLEIPDRTRPPVPMPTFELQASRADITQGRFLYAQFCSRCHGGEAVSGGGTPDLRYASTAIHATFEDIVRGGVRRQFGMPSFAEDVTSVQARMIQAFILERARESTTAAARR
jgi:quinohemoprotein ethanol dehydrogenase